MKNSKNFHRPSSAGQPEANLAGQTGVYQPVFQGLPVVSSRKTDRKGHFGQDTGRVSGDTWPSRDFSEKNCDFFLCAVSAPYKSLVDVSDIFYLFPLGEGKGESEVPGGGEGDGILLKIPGGGGFSGRVGAAGRQGWEGVCGEFGGGGLTIFFSGPKCPPRKDPSPLRVSISSFITSFNCRSRSWGLQLSGCRGVPKSMAPSSPIICVFLAPTCFAASFFPSFALSTPPFPRQFSSPKSPLSGTSFLLFLVQRRQPAGAGFWGRFWTGSPHRKKKENPFFWRAREGEFRPLVLRHPELSAPDHAIEVAIAIAIVVAKALNAIGCKI